MVATPPPRSSRNAPGGLRYLTTGLAHDGSDKPRSWFVDGIDCAPETADAEWRAVRQRFGKDGTRPRHDAEGHQMIGADGLPQVEGAYVQAVHLVLSYDPSEHDPNDPEAIRRAHEQSKEVAELIRDGHQVVLATQNDGLGSDGVGKVHTHIYLNAIHPETGRSANGRHHAKDINRLRRTVDAVSLAHGRDNAALMAERDRSIRRTPKEIEQKRDGEYVWKDDLAERLDRSLTDSTSREDWKARADAEGVEIVYRGRTGVSYRFTDDEGEERKVRARDLGSRWTAKNTDHDLAQNLQLSLTQQAPVIEAEDEWDFDVIEVALTHRHRTTPDEEKHDHDRAAEEPSRGAGEPDHHDSGDAARAADALRRRREAREREQQAVADAKLQQRLEDARAAGADRRGHRGREAARTPELGRDRGREADSGYDLGL